METFIWVLVVLMACDAIIKVIWLSIGTIQEPVPLAVALEAIIAAGLVTWGICLLNAP